MKQTEGGVLAAKGYRAAAAAAEIKYRDRDDMALIFSEVPAAAAGVFTLNQVKAAPVLWDREIIKEGRQVRAIVANAGIANACTGTQGREDCAETARALARALSVEEKEVLVASTGVIGMTLPMERIFSGVEALSASLSTDRDAAAAAAKAIMTTDTRPKEAAYAFEIDGVTCHIGAMAKGSGMIHPNMGTMLCFVTTDAAVGAPLLQRMLEDVVQDTFHMISVDGDTSTNDTLIVLANGASGAPEIKEDTPAYETFFAALEAVCRQMAMMLAGDGEGATALFEVRVTGADTKEHARTLAKSVITSSLTKAAIFGHDANWGRILCALGYAGVVFDQDRVSLSISSAHGTLKIFADGHALPYSEEEAGRILSAEHVTALCDMHMGTEEATAYGCDLSYDYVRINADYRS